MARRPDFHLDDERRREGGRRLVTDRGPDTARLVDHLKLRALGGGAEHLLAAVEADHLDLAHVTDLTAPVGVGTAVLFMVDVSSVGGSDVVE